MHRGQLTQCSGLDELSASTGISAWGRYVEAIGGADHLSGEARAFRAPGALDHEAAGCSPMLASQSGRRHRAWDVGNLDWVLTLTMREASLIGRTAK